VEAIFHIKRCRDDDSMYYHVFGAFDAATQKRMRAVTAKLPEEGKYGYIKTELLAVYGQTSEAKANMYIDWLVTPAMGDMKPEDVLAEMTRLFVADDVFRRGFIRAMPDNMRAQLNAAEGLSLKELAAMAQRIARDQPTPQLNVLGKPKQNAKAGSRQGTRFPPRSGAGTPRGLCSYHFVQGKDAKQCLKPCAFGMPKQPQQALSLGYDDAEGGNANASC